MTRRFLRPSSSAISSKLSRSKLTFVMVENSASSMKALTDSSDLPSRRAWLAYAAMPFRP